MAEQIDKCKVVLGRIIRIKNTTKPVFSNAKDEYNAVQVENADGDGERCWLLTDREMKVLDDRAAKNPGILTHKSFLRDLFD